MGYFSLGANTTGSANTAMGYNALAAITTGTNNSAFGQSALDAITTGSSNIAVGQNALGALTTGSNNAALGQGALSAVTSGANNIAVGQNAGSSYTSSESNNIAIGATGTAGDQKTIRIGTTATISSCFIQGIVGRSIANTTAVLINTTTGQLGTLASSSSKYKDNIQDVGSYSSPIWDLRPVTFFFKEDPHKTLTVGLIAEEVDVAFPELVYYNQEKEPEGVNYYPIPLLILNEMKKQKKQIDELKSNVEFLMKKFS